MNNYDAYFTQNAAALDRAKTHLAALCRALDELDLWGQDQGEQADPIDPAWDWTLTELEDALKLVKVGAPSELWEDEDDEEPQTEIVKSEEWTADEGRD